MIGRTENRARSRRKSSTAWIAIIAAVGVLVVTAVTMGGVHIYKGQKYKDVFFPNATINSVNASEKTVEEVKELIAPQIDGYVLTLSQRGGVKEQITRADIGLHSEFDGSPGEMLSEQKPLSWWGHRKEETGYQIATMIACGEEPLQKKIDSLECFNEEEMQAPVGAYVSDYISGQGYTAVPRESSNLLEKEVVEAGITLVIRSPEEDVSFGEPNAYMKPEITSTDEELVEVAGSLSKHTSVTVTHKFGDKTGVLPGETIHSWVGVNADETIGLDRDRVAAYVRSLADKYNMAYRERTLKTSYGKEVTISSGFYGWRIDQSVETDELYGTIRSGENQARESIYSQKASNYGTNDYGNTYVEINLTAQHLFFYRDGKLLVESDFVLGNSSKGYDTSPGAYPITYKERNATLKGEDYRAPVDYWILSNGNIGMCDAGWHSSSGGNVFKTSGSHGCVNLPSSVAKTIYKNIETGMPMLCYILEGTGSRTTSSVPKETATATTAAPTTTAPATRAPAETTAASETSTSVPEASPVETTAALETTATPETAEAPETRQPNGLGDVDGGGNSSNGEKGSGV